MLHQSYEQQLKDKQKLVDGLLSKFCKVDKIIGMDNPYHYRNKVHAVFDHDRKGNPISGVYEAGTHRVVPVENCLIENKKADEINEYFALNVDPTARPMNINVDYRDALFRSTRDIRSALKGDYPVESLTGLERSYYNTCKSYLNGNVTTANAWAAYASRITAVGLLVDSGIESNIPLSLGDVDAEVPPELLKLEKQAFLQIVCGDKPVAYFDTFVSDWYSNGGKELTQKVRGAYQEQ